MAKILIVDDDPDHVATLAKLLEVFGHQVATASNGREALPRILSTKPDIVLLDLFMPGMNGASLLEVLRSDPSLQSLPVIVFSGIADSPMADRLRALNVSCLLGKGNARIDDIEHAIKTALAGQRC
jgi:CheY-like chemotaxis protein